MPADTDTLLYLIRHGATPSNEEKPRRLQGCGVDSDLSPTGLLQARDTATFLAQFDLDAVYASPLRRAMQTAEEIARRQHLTVSVVDGLREVHVGQWERLDWETIRRDFPLEYSRFMADSSTYGYPGGESYADVANRVSPVFDSLMSANHGQRIAVIAHSVVNRTWLSVLLGVPLSQAKELPQDNCAILLGVPLSQAKELPQDNCAINVIRYRHNKARLLTLNATFHITSSLTRGATRDIS